MKLHKFISTISLSLVFLAGCTTDKDIKADIAAKAKKDINFIGITYTVKNKIVILTGTCPSIKSMQNALQSVQSVKVIKGVINKLQIAPVTLNMDLPLKQAADSVLSKYPTVTAQVTQGKIMLTGDAAKKEMDKLMPAMLNLHAAGIENKVSVSNN